MKIEEKSNKDLSILLKEITSEHENVKKEILEKLNSMDNLENRYKEILKEMKKRYNIE